MGEKDRGVQDAVEERIWLLRKRHQSRSRHAGHAETVDKDEVIPILLVRRPTLMQQPSQRYPILYVPAAEFLKLHFKLPHLSGHGRMSSSTYSSSSDLISI